MSSFALRYAQGNLLLGRGGESAGLYRLGMSAYPFLPTGGKWALQRRLQRLAHTIAADFSLWRVNRAYPAGRYVEHTAGLLDERHQDPVVWRAFLEGHRDRLCELGSHVPEVYLAVSLNRGAPAGLGAGLIRGVDRARRRVEELAGITNASPITARELSELAAAEQRVHERVNGVLAARRASTIELQWLLRRAASRGVSEPDLDQHWQPDALVISAPGGGGRSSRSSTTCAAARTRRSPSAGRRLWWTASRAAATRRCSRSARSRTHPSSPAQPRRCCSRRWRPSGSPSTRRFTPVGLVTARRSRRCASGSPMSSTPTTSRCRAPRTARACSPGGPVLAREYEAQLQAGGHPPMLYAQISLAVGAPSEEELERRVAVLREQYGDIQLHRPAGLQHEMFFEHLPRADGWL